MRRAISVTLATAMLGAGLYILIFQLVHGSFYGAALLLGGFLTAVGAGWLWSDLSD